MFSLSICASARHSPRLGKRNTNAAMLRYGACAVARCNPFVVLQAVTGRFAEDMETSAFVSRHRSCRSVCSCRPAKPHKTRSRLPAGQAEASVCVYTAGHRPQHNGSVSYIQVQNLFALRETYAGRLPWTLATRMCTDHWSMVCLIPGYACDNLPALPTATLGV